MYYNMYSICFWFLFTMYVSFVSYTMYMFLRDMDLQILLEFWVPIKIFMQYNDLCFFICFHAITDSLMPKFPHFLVTECDGECHAWTHPRNSPLVTLHLCLANCNRYLSINQRERDHWGDLGIDGWIILGWISRGWDVGIWTGLGWPRIETGGGRLWVR